MDLYDYDCDFGRCSSRDAIVGDRLAKINDDYLGGTATGYMAQCSGNDRQTGIKRLHTTVE